MKEPWRPTEPSRGWSHFVSDIKSGIKFLVGLIIFVVVAGAVLSFILPDKTVYSFRYSIPEDRVHVDHKPEDCDWLYAPMGEKDCHYEKAVATLDKDGNPTNEPSQVRDIYITWTKETGE